MKETKPVYDCPHCGGTGEGVVVKGDKTEKIPCYSCKGTGQKEDNLRKVLPQTKPDFIG